MPKTKQTAGPRSRNVRGEGEKLRSEIVEAALAVLSALGPDDPFSLRAVAKAAKIAAPSVYIHFPDRNVLLLAVLERLFAEQIAIREAAEEDAARTGGGAWERLLARSLASVRFGIAHPGHYKALFEARVVPRLTDPRIANLGRPLLDRSIQLIREIPSKGARVSDDAERLAFLLWAGLHGVISLRINKPSPGLPSALEMAEQVTRAIIRPAEKRVGTRK